MRLLLVCLLSVFCVVTEAQADDWGFRQQVASYLDSRPYTSDVLKGRDTEVIVTIAIDRDGKLVQAEVTKGSGTAMVDAEISRWLRSLEPFPPIPTDLKAPQRFSIRAVVAPPLWKDEAIKRTMKNVCKGC